MPTIELTPLPGPFGVEVHGVDVAGAVGPETLRTLAHAYVEHKLLLFRNQGPSAHAYATFARQWGEPRYERYSEVRVIGSLLWGIGFYFVSPYQIGLVAAIDRKGRVAVASAAVMNMGYAVGPAVAGRILQFMDRDWLMMIIAVSTFVSMLLLLPLAIRVDRNSRTARAPAHHSGDTGRIPEAHARGSDPN